MAENIDLLLIKPGDKKKVYGNLSSTLSAIEPPLWAALIAAYIRRDGYSIRVIDVEAEDISPEDVAQLTKRYKPVLAGFVVTGSNLSASTWHMTGAREYINEFKKLHPHAKTFLWGLHPSSLPEKTLKEENVDFVIQGEGFSTISELIKVLKRKPNTCNYDISGLWYLLDGAINSNPRANLIKDLDDLPTPAWDLFPMDKYRAHNWQCFHDLSQRNTYGVIYTSFGCPFNCTFCNLKSLFGAPGIRYRSPQKVIEDIDLLVNDYRIKNIKVLDECFVLNKKHVIDICDLIISRGYDLNIWAYARIDTVDTELLKKLKQAGFNWLCYGIESGNKEVRSRVAKSGFGSEDIKKVIQITKDSGINILGNFMFGLPDDTLETMQQTLDLAKELNCEYTNFYATMAYPGSDLYEEALRTGVRLPEIWRGYAAFSEECIPLPTKYLSAKEVLHFRDKAFLEFHSSPTYLKLIKEKFGEETLSHIQDMLAYPLKRKLFKN